MMRLDGGAPMRRREMTRASRRGARRLGVAVLAALLAGCAVGPDYQRPPTQTPEIYRSQVEPQEAASFADQPWWEIFNDEMLRGLVDEALKNNYDLRGAVARVAQAQHLVGVTRGPLFPSVGYEGGAARGRFFTGPSFPSVTGNEFLGAFTLAWEIDVWGRIRRATEQAEAEMYATDDVKRAVVLSLVSGVANSYFTLQELDLELEIATRTVASFQDTEQLFMRRYTGGVDSKLSVERAKAARAQAASVVPSLERQITIQENTICVLLGRPPGPVERQPLLTMNALPPQTPPGLPSELLERRPDILQAEQTMAAENAAVGVATANFFPRLGLTTLYGGQSSDLQKVFQGPGNIWQVAGSLMGPLFQGGALIENLRATNAGYDAAVQQYQQTVLTALGEVSNALISQRKLEEQRVEQDQEVAALRESVRLATLRYVGGLATYYEVLEAQQQLFPAELSLAQTDRNRLLAVVDLERSLGGGWQANDTPIDESFWPTGP
ncbi:MAG: efflux transporter outer membrane subunit [bacterium]